MGLFIQQKDNRSELQQRLAAELREKAKLKASGAEPLDQTKNSNYLKNTDMVSERGWFFVVIVAVVIVIGAVIFVMNR